MKKLSNRLSAPSLVLCGAALACGLAAAGAVVALAQDNSPSASVTAKSVGTDPPPTGKLSELLNVFSRPPSIADVVPGAQIANAEAVLATAPNEALKPGSLESDRARVLLTGLGDMNTTLAAVPTRKGNVCLFILGGLSGCASTANFRSGPVDASFFDVDRVGTGSAIAAYGLALNDVVAVSITDNTGARHAARVSNNAFFVQLEDPAVWPLSIVVRLGDGSTQTLEITGGAPPTRHP